MSCTVYVVLCCVLAVLMPVMVWVGYRLGYSSGRLDGESEVLEHGRGDR